MKGQVWPLADEEKDGNAETVNAETEFIDTAAGFKMFCARVKMLEKNRTKKQLTGRLFAVTTTLEISAKLPTILHDPIN